MRGVQPPNPDEDRASVIRIVVIAAVILLSIGAVFAVVLSSMSGGK